ncbi:MAG: hypothetical protein EA402_03340 [Planctomycetota bacterium]|nr:MAG: hypothetical protein EA402_03340 [Planctomycetota bacterium]
MAELLASRSGNDAPLQSLQELVRSLVQIQAALSADDPGLRGNLHTISREVLADALLPPRHLHDYDVVLPLPLLANQQPLPARLAISQRQQGGTSATFLRVDVELSQLGPLSLRLSEVSGHPLGITLFHGPQAAASLRNGIVDLRQDLEQLGIEAHIRLADINS